VRRRIARKYQSLLDARDHMPDTGADEDQHELQVLAKLVAFLRIEVSEPKQLAAE
jgi:hypothetical protein